MVVTPVSPVWSPDPAVAAAERRRSLSRLPSYVSTRVYLPACAIVAVAALLIGIGWSTGWGGADYAGSVRLLRIVVLGPISLGIIGLILIVERIRPAQHRALIARGHRQDAIYTVLNVTLIVPLMTALTLSFVEVTKRVFPWIVLPQMGAVPRASSSQRSSCAWTG